MSAPGRQLGPCLCSDGRSSVPEDRSGALTRLAHHVLHFREQLLACQAELPGPLEQGLQEEISQPGGKPRPPRGCQPVRTGPQLGPWCGRSEFVGWATSDSSPGPSTSRSTTFLPSTHSAPGGLATFSLQVALQALDLDTGAQGWG